MASAMLGLSAWAFQTGNLMLGQIIGWSLVAAALVNVSTGFCIPSFIYGVIFGKPSACENDQAVRELMQSKESIVAILFALCRATPKVIREEIV